MVDPPLVFLDTETFVPAECPDAVWTVFGGGDNVIGFWPYAEGVSTGWDLLFPRLRELRIAGGRPAAGYFLLSRQEKSSQREGGPDEPPLAW